MCVEHEKQQGAGDEVKCDDLHEQREPSRDSGNDEPAWPPVLEPPEESGDPEDGEEQVVPGRERRGIVRQGPRHAQQRHPGGGEGPD
jgi:hypothetical protein